MEKTEVIIDVSARHVHIRPEDVEVLFGRPDALTLRQSHSSAFAGKGQEVFNERVKLVGPKGTIENVTILGPLRRYKQAEISKTDARVLGIDAVIRLSGHHEGTPGIDIVGPCGTLKLETGCIVAKRHVHMSEKLAAELGHKSGDVISVEVTGTERPLVFHEVSIEAYPVDKMPTVMHIDTDEANAADIRPGLIGKLIV